MISSLLASAGPVASFFSSELAIAAARTKRRSERGKARQNRGGKTRRNQPERPCSRWPTLRAATSKLMLSNNQINGRSRARPARAPDRWDLGLGAEWTARLLCEYTPKPNASLGDVLQSWIALAGCSREVDCVACSHHPDGREVEQTT